MRFLALVWRAAKPAALLQSPLAVGGGGGGGVSVVCVTVQETSLVGRVHSKPLKKQETKDGLLSSQGEKKRKRTGSLLGGFLFGSDLGTLARPSHQTVLERALGIRNQSSPVLRLSHSSVWYHDT